MIRQKSSDGRPLVEVQTAQGIVPGGAASVGKYTDEMAAAAADPDDPPRGRDD
jgi:hypothetical protein